MFFNINGATAVLLSTGQFDFADGVVLCDSDTADIWDMLQYWLGIDCW